MAFSVKQMALIVATVGILSFVFGVVAENKKLSVRSDCAIGILVHRVSRLVLTSRANTGLAVTFLLWPTIQEQLFHTRNVHHNLETDCPTAKTGILGGGAFLSLNSCLFWLVSLMLAGNVRSDYFDELSDEDFSPASYHSADPIQF